MDIDVVYILGSGSKFNDLELYYSIKSLRKNLLNFRNIIVVGSKPRCDVDVFHYAYADESKFKNVNILNKIKYACSIESISETILVFSDDVFLMQKVDALNFPILYTGDLKKTVLNRDIPSGYREVLCNTFHALKGKGFPTLNYNLHFGFPIVKEKFINAVSEHNLNIRRGYAVKSLYANTIGLPGGKYSDSKIKNPKDIPDRLFFSISDSFMKSGGVAALDKLFT